MLRGCRPVEAVEEVMRYLLARGCALPPNGSHLLAHPRHRHPSGYVGPALVAVVTHAATGEPMTLHRTWVRPDGRKADLDKPRLLWGGLPKAEGVVRLWPHDEVTLGLAVAEGIESALAAAHGFTPVWACLDAGNVAALPVLPGIESLTIVADHDPTGLTKAETCARRWAEAGVEVRVWCSPVQGADFNDHVRGVAA